VSRVISQPFLSVFLTSTLDWGRQLTPGTGHFNTWKNTRYPLHGRVVWAAGRVWNGAENVTHTGIRFSDRPVKSESLDLLRYIGPVYNNYNIIIIIIIIIM
jgi:hypothetical protein